MNSDEWPTVRLGDFVEVVHGFAFKTKYANNKRSAYALFTRKNVAPGGGFREDGPRYYHGDFKERFVLEPGDLMVVLTDLSKEGDLLGFPALVPRTDCLRYLHNQRVGKVVARGNGLDRRFLYALLRSPDYRRHVLNTASQTTVRDTAPSRLHDYRFKLPPITEQRRIATVIGALDDKIDSDRRLPTLLEETAAVLFRARFVDFVKVEEFEESEIGLIPKGWRVGTLGDLATVMKQSVTPASRPEQRFEHFGIPAFDDGRRPEIVSGGELLSSKTLLPPGDCVLLSKLNPGTKRVWWPRPSGAYTAVCSPEFIVLVSRDRLPSTYLYAVVRHDERFYGELLSHVSGTTGSRQRVKPDAALTCRIVVPTADSLREWDAIARPLYDGGAAALVESAALAAVRNELLPRLVSGEIRVPDANDPAEVIELATEALAAPQ